MGCLQNLSPIGSAARLRLVFVAVSSFLLATIAAAAMLAASGRVEGAPLYAAFAAFCHQQADRSWSLWGAPLPVCVRCLGVYAGAWIAALSAPGFRPRLFWAALAAAVLSWLAESGWNLAFPTTARFLTGGALGFTAFAALVSLGRSDDSVSPDTT